jgi:hypothetical protein
MERPDEGIPPPGLSLSRGETVYSALTELR